MIRGKVTTDDRLLWVHHSYYHQYIHQNGTTMLNDQEKLFAQGIDKQCEVGPILINSFKFIQFSVKTFSLSITKDHIWSGLN